MSKKYRSEALASIHETMEALHEIGAIDKRTMRGFDETCLTPIQDLAPDEIKEIREREHVSQTVFANWRFRPSRTAIRRQGEQDSGVKPNSNRSEATLVF